MLEEFHFSGKLKKNLYGLFLKWTRVVNSCVSWAGWCGNVWCHGSVAGAHCGWTAEGRSLPEVSELDFIFH